MRKTALICGLMLFLAGSCISYKYQFEPVNNEVSPKHPLQRQIDSIVLEKMTQYKIPGMSLGIVHADSVMYAAGYGVRNIRSQEVVCANSLFHAASISKLFTAQAIMTLVKENKLRLDNRISELIPQISATNSSERK